MSRVSSYFDLQISKEATEVLEYVYSEAFTSNNKSLQANIRSKKLQNYKAIISSSNTVLASINSCLHIQGKVIENLKKLKENCYFSRETNLQQKFREKQDLRTKIKITQNVISEVISGCEKELGLDGILQTMNNFELLRELIASSNEVDKEYLERLDVDERIVMNKLIRRANQEIIQINADKHCSQMKYALGRIANAEPESYASLIQIFLGQRKYNLHVALQRFSENTTAELLKFVVCSIETEYNLITSSIHADPYKLLSQIFALPFKSLKSTLKSQEFIYKLPEIFTHLSLLSSALKHPIKSLQTLYKISEVQLENYTKKLLSHISALSSLNFTQTPFYLKLIIFQVHFSLFLIKQNKLLEKYFPIITEEIIDKVLGYFYNTGNLANTIGSLNIYEFVSQWGGAVDCEELKNKIVRLEVERIFSQNYLNDRDGMVNVLSYYFGILQNSKKMIAKEVFLIENSKTRQCVIAKIGEEICKDFCTRVKSKSFSAISERYFKYFFLF